MSIHLYKDKLLCTIHLQNQDISISRVHNFFVATLHHQTLSYQRYCILSNVSQSAHHRSISHCTILLQKYILQIECTNRHHSTKYTHVNICFLITPSFPYISNSNSQVVHPTYCTTKHINSNPPVVHQLTHYKIL